MLDGPEACWRLERMTTAPAAPILSPVMSIEEGWVDYNGHLNQAYYSVLFDRAIDDALMPAGLGPDYVTARNATYMSVEKHLCYVRELFKTDHVRVASRVLDVDDKRLHLYCEMHHADEGWLSCTSEWMFLHVDMGARRTAPWPSDVREKLEALKVAALRLPRPTRAGRSIGIERRARAQNP
jgi:acyl-CoA thioester hydrolase